MDKETPKNIAETLAEVLPKAHIALDAIPGHDRVLHVAVPKGHDLKTIDLEHLLSAPRRAKLAATMADAPSFLAYLARHASVATVVWCEFNPQTFALSFRAVLDDFGTHAQPGWRGHTATYTPEASAEWKVWTAANKKLMAQLDFASYLEQQEGDIAGVEGMPTSLQMMTMATGFEANSEKRVKSVVKLQGGGVRVDFIDDDNADTEAQMKLFERFAIGIPVFWAGPAYRIDSRLKYRHGSGKVTFWYELIRPDRVHESAAKELIDLVRNGLPEGVPMLMGITARS
jgi:uncharacterized protein YfdQ (DUF2303 family)